ncbi:MAG TPA: cytochrome C oxidase subunit IV family protein [Herpetosiphonaceae bacterium]|nr:cytochrome C oxidase subunit IV family protein [Herpetosiphonaceae bacterium]
MAHHAQGNADSAAPHAAHNSPSSRTYINIFIVLFVVTAIEVGASYLSDFGVPVWGEIAVLVLLAAVKGLLVVMFYMHLRFDSRWFIFLFSAAMVLATVGLVAFMILFAYHRGVVA